MLNFKLAIFERKNQNSLPSRKMISFSALSTVPSPCIFLPYCSTMTLKNLCTPDTALLSNGQSTWQSLYCCLEKGSEDDLSRYFFGELQDLFGILLANIKYPTLSSLILAPHCFTTGTSFISAPLS